ncbi:CidA/LrgA family protein [Bergeyella sp. RCAD1439]|uniref:CidA/LrgA family protein n=1 Tax=Bergeyella anatis TaxID=3113737 RepID=UPI002E198460|nr:CidA/LrgA family protein [Bergeyella sp. RCAD1439]
MFIPYLLVIFGFLALGELVVYLTQIRFPSSIIGMLLLTFSLHKGWVKLQWVKGISDLLISNLGLFFVPTGVGLVLYFGVIRANFFPFVFSIVLSTALVIGVTGKVYQSLRKKIK